LKGSQNLLNKGARYASIHQRMFSSTHSKVVILGAGAAGKTVSAQLINTGRIQGKDITIIDPVTQHHYQPGYTMIGGGVFGTAEEAKKIESSLIMKP